MNLWDEFSGGKDEGGRMSGRGRAGGGTFGIPDV